MWSYLGFFPYHLSQVTGFGGWGQQDHWDVLQTLNRSVGCAIIVVLSPPLRGSSDHIVLSPDGVGVSSIIVWS